jgi:SAM-dependent methyltransferase
MSDPHRPRDASRSFEAQWRERFEEFAELREDDAGIAGWSASGLDTRFRCFRRLWKGAAAGSRWLDVGCGAGTYSRWLVDRRLSVVGLDYSQPTLDKARQRLPSAIALCAGDAMRLPFRDASFDGVLCFGVLQAVSETTPILREIARVLRPGATLYIDALNGEGIAARLTEARRHLRRKPPHLRYERAGRLKLILDECGFAKVERHWLPIAPSRLTALQPVLESRVFMAILTRMPPAGRLFSHSIVCTATRRPA